MFISRQDMAMLTSLRDGVAILETKSLVRFLGVLLLEMFTGDLDRSELPGKGVL